MSKFKCGVWWAVCDSKVMPYKEKKVEKLSEIHRFFFELNKDYQKYGLSTNDLEKLCFKRNLTSLKYVNNSPTSYLLILVILAIAIFYNHGVFHDFLTVLLGIRCIVPNNYFVWEATRPLSSCDFCINITSPVELRNLTRREFVSFAYSSQPMLIKRAFNHWPAMQFFNFDFFKNLYESIEDSYKSVDEECQFLHFKSNFISIKDVFSMDRKRINNNPGEESWYVGWGNCHPQILQEMRRYYPKPHFLPEDCEIPSKEYVFMGYEDGATMHLDFINRLMWQAQLKGSKTWVLLPPPECEYVCSKLSFLVEPGDAVLLDTRVWYHGTTITAGEFSLSIQSEYG